MAYPHEQSFAEKHGGFVISAAFHLAFLMVLHNVTVAPTTRRPEKKPDPIRIELSPLEEITEAEPEQAPPVLELQPVVATVAETGSADETLKPEGELPLGELEEMVQLAALPPSEISRPKDELPAPSQTLIEGGEILVREQQVESEDLEQSTQEDSDLILDERIQEFLRQREQTLTEYNEIVGDRGSDRVARRLSMARADLEGKRWLETTEGGQEGVIRTFTSEGVPPKIAEEVYGRYGIRTIIQYFDADQANYGTTPYLNSARIGGAHFTRQKGRGMFQAVSLSNIALSHLARLERDAVIERGLDPARTRILEVHFGVASVGNTYDLVVDRMRVAPMEFRP